MSNATELLRRALEAWTAKRSDTEWSALAKEIRTFLAAEKETEQDCYGDGNVYRGVRSNDSKIRTVFSRSELARKPMNGDEVLEAFYKADISGLQSFTEGVRCAEEFHGIGGDDE